VDGTGWVTVDLENISSGSPLAVLPIDPNNGSTNCGAGAAACFYSFTCNGTSYELMASMESTRYAASGGDDVEANTSDGGNNANAYEIGNDPALDL
jgi:hypothetical protein